LSDPQIQPPVHTSRIRDEERQTRKPLEPFDRWKLLLAWVALFAVGIWQTLQTAPDLRAAEQTFFATMPGTVLAALIGLEILRQVHFILAETFAGYHQAWQKVFHWNEKSVAKVSPWTRFRLGRVVTWALWIYLFGAVIGSVTNMSPVDALVHLPQLISSNVGTFIQYVLYVAVALAQFAAIFWFLGKGGIDIYMPDDIKTRFSDVWGQDQVLNRIKENIVFLENPEEIEKRGGHVPGGILLWGPPGTGKTLIAEAVAGETGLPFVFVDPGAFINMFMGIGVLKVRRLFRTLRKLSLRHGGVIVFFDEADTLGSRGGNVSKASPARAVSLADDCNGSAFISENSRAVLIHAHTPATPEGVQPRRMIVPGGTSGGFDGTLQALLTELSGLKKPRGFMNRVVRKALGLRPKQPPKYRILVMMASNMPDSLDPALMRPGRLDRIYRVGYPSKEGRIETYRNYLRRVEHQLTDEQIERLATVSPYATGAVIKDTVNEALVLAITDGRQEVTYADLVKAKSLKQHGLPDGSAYVDRERHSVAVHEASHAVTMYLLQHTSTIDVATIERRGDVGGFVSPIPLEDRFVQWMSEIDIDVMTFLASLAGERMFYDGDHTQGVGGDLAAATSIVTRSILSLGMGDQLRSFNPIVVQNSGLTSAYGMPLVQGISWEGEIAGQVERRLQDLYVKVYKLLSSHRHEVLAVAHALEVHKTISGDDIAAVIEGAAGPLVDGRPYATKTAKKALETYHKAAAAAHAVRTERPPVLPEIPSFE
jgi:cell division protease FtsH